VARRSTLRGLGAALAAARGFDVKTAQHDKGRDEQTQRFYVAVNEQL
jgi:hypothetical protein